METAPDGSLTNFDLALETSLVEWKLVSEDHDGNVPLFLGNFLSGMETSARPAPSWRGRHPWKLP